MTPENRCTPNLSPRINPKNCEKCGAQCCKYYEFWYSKSETEVTLSEMQRLAAIEALFGKVEILEDDRGYIVKINSPCHYLTQENKCSIYTSSKRPYLCRKFPHPSNRKTDCPYSIPGEPEYEELKRGYFPRWIAGTDIAGVAKPREYFGNKEPIVVTVSVNFLKEALTKIPQKSEEWGEEFVGLAIYPNGEHSGAAALVHPYLATGVLKDAYAYLIGSINIDANTVYSVEGWNQHIVDMMRGACE